MSTLARYVVAQYLRVFCATLIGATSLYLVIEFFDRIGRMMQYDPEFGAVAAHFLFKLPGIAAQIYPAATLLAVLISLGLMARSREILALRACGVSTWQLAYPLVAVAAACSLAALAWNEKVVPPADAQAR